MTESKVTLKTIASWFHQSDTLMEYDIRNRYTFVFLIWALDISLIEIEIIHDLD